MLVTLCLKYSFLTSRVFSVFGLMEPSSSLPSELIQQIRALTRNQLFELQIELTHEINYRWDIERAVGTFRQWGVLVNLTTLLRVGVGFLKVILAPDPPDDVFEISGSCGTTPSGG